MKTSRVFLFLVSAALVVSACTPNAEIDPNRGHIQHRDGSVTYVGASRLEKQDKLMRDHRDALNRALFAF